MNEVLIPFNFTNGTKARAEQVNANFQAFKDVLNGGLEDGNFSNDAKIAPSKIAYTTDLTLVTISTSVANVATGVATAVMFDTVIYDPSSSFDAGTYAFTPSKVGYYRASPQVYTQQLSGGIKGTGLMLYKNGVFHEWLYDRTKIVAGGDPLYSTNYAHLLTETVFYADNTTDTYQVIIYNAYKNTGYIIADYGYGVSETTVAFEYLGA